MKGISAESKPGLSSLIPRGYSWITTGSLQSGTRTKAELLDADEQERNSGFREWQIGDSQNILRRVLGEPNNSTRRSDSQCPSES
jgi:hypothetical protein